ncbi:MAG: SseB family protein [Eubacterium sp.]|nr:SseB family protein [Eubacterium sp.]
MKTYFTLDLYYLEEEKAEIGETAEETESAEAEAAEDAEAEGEPVKTEDLKPFRSVTVTLHDGHMIIKSVSDDPDTDFELEYSEQLTSEFLIQTELLDIRKWDPMHYSPAFSGGNICSWEMDYNGLKGGEAVRSGKGTYPKGWPLLMDLIDAYNDKTFSRQESVHIAAEYASFLLGRGAGSTADMEAVLNNEDSAGDNVSPSGEAGLDGSAGSPVTKAIDMVNILAAMQMPQDVIAAGVLRAVSDEKGYDPEIGKVFDGPVGELLGEYGGTAGLSAGERRLALLESVKASESIYFKKLVLAEVLADLISVKARIDAGGEFSDDAMTRDEMGLFYAEMISSLGDLDGDERAGLIYSVLVDMYKSVFVSYSLDSIRGAIYQMQGDAAGVMLRRGEYDWRPFTGTIPDDASPVTKDLALFLADCWRRQADEAIVRDGNKAGLRDVPDLKVLKVVMGSSQGRKKRKDNKVALSVINRMVEEGEQILAALHAGEKELRLIERGDIDNVANISVSFLGLEDDEGDKMAAVFTSMDEIGEIGEEDIEAVPLKTLLRFVKHMDKLDGIIIDPFSDRFLVTKEKIAEMLDSLGKAPAGM